MSRPELTNGYLTRVLASVFSLLSQEGNRKHPEVYRVSSRPSQGLLDSKVRPRLSQAPSGARHAVATPSADTYLPCLFAQGWPRQKTKPASIGPRNRKARP